MPRDHLNPTRGQRTASRLLASALAAGVALALGGCSGSTGSVRGPAGGLTIASGGSQGVYYLYANEYKRVLETDIPDLKVTVVTTAGSGENIGKLASNEAQLGFATADSIYQTADATAAAHRNLRAVARVYDEGIHLVVRADSAVRSVKDLRGLRVSTGQPSSSTELVANRLLGAVGLVADRDLKRSRDGINASVAKLGSGAIDAFFWSGGFPTSGITTLAKTAKIRLVPLGGYVNELRKKYGTYYRRAVIPTGTYPGVPQAVTIGVPNYLLVASNLDENLVYRLTEVLFKRRSRIADKVPSGQLLDARSAISTMPIPLHAGAERYYRDAKP